MARTARQGEARRFGTRVFLAGCRASPRYEAHDQPSARSRPVRRRRVGCPRRRAIAFTKKRRRSRSGAWVRSTRSMPQRKAQRTRSAVSRRRSRSRVARRAPSPLPPTTRIRSARRSPVPSRVRPSRPSPGASGRCERRPPPTGVRAGAVRADAGQRIRALTSRGARYQPFLNACAQPERRATRLQVHMRPSSEPGCARDRQAARAACSVAAISCRRSATGSGRLNR